MTNTYKIAVLPGDGIGPEVIREAVAVLEAVQQRFSICFDMVEAPVGWAAIDACGTALPPKTLELCRESHAVLFGAVGFPDRDATVKAEHRPERAALLRLRKEFGLFANLRPMRLLPELSHICPLRPERFRDGIDMLVVRELTGGLYFGQPKRTEEIADGHRRAVDSMVYSTPEIERIAHTAFREARRRRKKLTSVDKANVLETSVLWREVVTEISTQYEDVHLEHMLVDNAAMQLVLRPGRFDVILCENTFGDILSDEVAALSGSLGMLPSASLGHGGDDHHVFGLYEPAGGTAPDIAGQGIANPISQILSAALMLRHSFNLEDVAVAVESAVGDAVARGIATQDIRAESGKPAVSTHEMGKAVIESLLIPSPTVPTLLGNPS